MLHYDRTKNGGQVSPGSLPHPGECRFHVVLHNEVGAAHFTANQSLTIQKSHAPGVDIRRKSGEHSPSFAAAANHFAVF